MVSVVSPKLCLWGYAPSLYNDAAMKRHEFQMKGARVAEERIQMEPVLESVLRYCLKDAKERMEKGEMVVPFTALAVGDTLFMEEHAADDPSESFSSARKTVAGARGAQAYGFCYDGYIEVDTALENDVKKDCIIAEGGTPGADYGHAIGLPYRVDSEGNVKFNDEPIYVSKSLNYMVYLTPDGEEAVDFGIEEFTKAKEADDEE